MRRWRSLGTAVVAGAVVAVILGVLGTWLGGLIGAAVIALGILLSAEVSDRLKRRRDEVREQKTLAEQAHAALDRVSDAAVAPAAGLASRGVVFWLRPDQRVVGFIDRPELTRLRRWCEDREAPGALLLTGEGGVGKTRLALRLAEDLQEQGWLCRVVRTDGEAKAVAAARATSRGPILLIVDYAETRPDLAKLLRAVVDDTGDRLRVIMLARGLGEWWAQLEGAADADVRHLVAAAGPVPVGTLVGNQTSGADLVRRAVPEFALAIGMAVPGPLQVTVPDKQVPILVLHAAALLAVLNAAEAMHTGPVHIVADDQVLAGLLAREKLFWHGSLQTAGLAGPGGLDSVIAAQAVAVACLITVADEDGAAQALRRIPGLADSPSALLQRIARWLRQLYPAALVSPPGPESRWWGSLQPDLLAERHVVDVLADAPSLAATCLRDLTDEQARAAVTLLARACVHRPAAPTVIAEALRADLPGLVMATIAVAVQTGGGLGQVLASVLSDADTPLDSLIQIEQAIPHPTVALAEAETVVTARIRRLLPTGAGEAEIAKWHDRHAAALSQAGRTDDAVPFAREAVDLYRKLTSVSPRYRPDLARTLSNLSWWLIQLGRPAEALPSAREAVDICRQQVATSGVRHRPGLAASLGNLWACFYDLGRWAEGLPVIEESVAIYRELAATQPDCYRPELATALSNLGNGFFELDGPAEALPVIEEAVDIRRELATDNPDRYRPDLAAALNNLGLRLYQLDRVDEALPVTEEALGIRRELATDYPDRYRPDLASSLSHLSIWLYELDRPADALPVAEDAAAMYRALAAAHPDLYRADLAIALNNLANCLSALDRPADALPVAEDVVTINRELAAVRPQLYRPNLAAALNNFASTLCALGRAAEAVPFIRETVTVYRELEAAHRGRYRSYLSASEDNLAALVATPEAGRP